jgi:hypothetical protein
LIRVTYVPQLKRAGKRVDQVDPYGDFTLRDGTARGWDNERSQSTDRPAGYGDFGLHDIVFGYRLIGERLAG